MLILYVVAVDCQIASNILSRTIHLLNSEIFAGDPSGLWRTQSDCFWFPWHPAIVTAIIPESRYQFVRIDQYNNWYVCACVRKPPLQLFDYSTQFRLWRITLITQHIQFVTDQDFIGSVVIQSEVDDDEDEDDNDDNINEFNDSGVVFGITSAVNISSKAPNGCLQQLRTFLIDKAEHSQSGRPIVNILKDEQKTIGLLLNERFVNIPPQIAVPMLESLQKEVQRAANKREGFRFDHYILIVKLYRKDGKNNKEEDIYSNGEEEVICEQALANFTYSVKGESDTALAGNWRESDSTLIPYRKVLLIDANQLDSIIHSIKQLIE